MKPLAEKILSERTTIMVAVFWPGAGYGEWKTYDAMDAARSRAEELARLGFGVPGKSPIHIVTTIASVIEFEVAGTKKDAANG